MNLRGYRGYKYSTEATCFKPFQLNSFWQENPMKYVKQQLA